MPTLCYFQLMMANYVSAQASVPAALIDILLTNNTGIFIYFARNEVKRRKEMQTTFPSEVSLQL